MGHEAGDELLKAVAERLKSTLRTADIVGRFGGDEFVVICRGLLEPDSVHRVAETILESFRVPFRVGHAEHVSTPSIGIATASVEDDRSTVELLRDADTAMYEAKRSRTGVSVFDERSREHLIEKLQVERQIRPAMATNQFAVFYQPIVDVKLNRVVSFEALVRWNHPEHGLLGPDRFLEIVEETGLMARLGEVVLRESLAQKALWTHMEPGANHLSIGVNVAERQLVDPRFPERIEEALEWANVRPEELTLEITEDLMIDHLDGSLSVLRRLGDIGVSLVIDDFGTGRSSLSYVKRLDMIDGIKIDRSFVTGIPKGKVDIAIVEAIVSMAEALELDMVAEGVETIEQARTLSNLGIQRMQGFLFDRPSPADGFDIKSSLTELVGLPLMFEYVEPEE
jgi:predicted signal transduction protein with EAL and GGDEF domain